MLQNVGLLSKNETKFLISLLESGNKTDAQIARETKMSKATANRIRKGLENNEIITDYIPIVDLDKIGIKVFSVLTFEWMAFGKPDLTSKTFNELEKDPHVVFLANGQGSNGTTSILFMGFANLKDYNDYFNEFRGKYSAVIRNINTMILPSDKIMKNDYTELVQYMLRREEGSHE